MRRLLLKFILRQEYKLHMKMHDDMQDDTCVFCYMNSNEAFRFVKNLNK